MFIVVASLLWCTGLVTGMFLNKPSESKPIVQITGLHSKITDELHLGPNGVDISTYETQLPMDGYRYYTWSKCRVVTDILVQTIKGTQPVVTLYYKDVCLK